MSDRIATSGTVPGTGSWMWKEPNASPGVRRMMAVVGSESSFERRREQLELLAGLEVTTKAVEWQAEAIGADIAGRQEVEIHRVLQTENVTVSRRDPPSQWFPQPRTDTQHDAFGLWLVQPTPCSARKDFPWVVAKDLPIVPVE